MKKKEINLIAVGAIVLLIIALIVLALVFLPGRDDETPTEPTTVETTGAPQGTEPQPEPEPEPTEPVHTHNWERITTEPTCITGGYTTCVCNCGESYVDDEVDALGHAWTAATCTESKVCSVCGVTEGRPTGHAWNTGKVVVEATEEQDGEKKFTCYICGETKTQAIPSLNHEHRYDEVIVTEPTCTEGGYTTHICRCADSYVDQEVPALGHDWLDATCVTPKVCQACGTIDGTALGHNWKEATCTEAKTCQRCGEVVGVAKGHKEKTVAGYDATCTETGLKDGAECSVCGVCLKERELIPAKGHKETTVKGKDATCTATGLKDGKQCSVCKVWLKEQEVIPAKGHQETTIKGYDATCTATGLKDGTQCSVCKEWLKKQEVIPAKGHQEVTVKGYDSTCTKTGLTDGKQCSVCLTWTAEQKTIALKAHTETTVAGKAATCTVTGLTDGKKCTVCGKVTVEQQTIPAKGHTSVIVKGYDSTCTMTGLTDGEKCGVCSAWILKQETIDLKTHTETTVAGKAATCTATGLTDGKKCTVCGKVTVAQQTIAAKGHTEITLARVLPTPSATGLTEGKKCSVCGTITVAQNTIPVLKVSTKLGYYSRQIRLNKGVSYTDNFNPGMDKNMLLACGYTKLNLSITLHAKETNWIVYNGAVLDIICQGKVVGTIDYGTFYDTSIFSNGWADATKSATIYISNTDENAGFSLRWRAAEGIGTSDDGWYLGTVEVSITAAK